ncbi:AraC family transcriptional regulator [Capsulimonas corticalis]|uniref:AraC family transcriptional regulator n=1 Tax=Capsulimonas corticalis TaxID=2219043 RepID=A0A402CUH5_9BACT|nr:AraC family transcriptional regulator [Capsulimonas corticalis]BDI28979.1 AraC family transcriptional regulator [Capsulimonas corticalis]
MNFINEAGNNQDTDRSHGTQPNAELREKVNREELVERIARAIPIDGTDEPVKGLRLNRMSSIAGPHHNVTQPSFCVIAQGAKEILLGNERYRYDPYKYFLATVELPAVSQLVEASPERPYLSLRLNLDSATVASVMLEAEIPSPRRDVNRVRAMNVSPLDSGLLDAAVRLVRLVDAPPAEARVLLPLITREIIFRLLAGDQGARLRHIAVLGGHTDRIARAIERLRHDFDKPLRIESLAHDLGMSPSGFHEHFKAVTAMSPLQFQKNLRLQEARRLLLGEDLDASSAAFRVGYEDTSHFSREYKRFFGHPPMRDIERLRAADRVEV